MALYEQLNANELTVNTIRNASEDTLMLSGTTVPTDATAGYSKGCLFYKTGAIAGTQSIYSNVGSATSCLFRLIGNPQATGYGAKTGGHFTAVTGSATQSILSPNLDARNMSFVQMRVTDDTDTLSSMITGLGGITVVQSADPLSAHAYSFIALGNNIPMPSHVCIAAGIYTTTGNDTIHAIPCAAAAVGDVVFANVNTLGTGNRSIITAVATAGAVTIVGSGALAANHIINYAVFRATNVGQTHYVYAAGTQAAVAGSATQTITITGLLATDECFVVYNTTDDSDTILTVKPAAGTLTYVASADPLVAHVASYMVLRAI